MSKFKINKIDLILIICSLIIFIISSYLALKDDFYFKSNDLFSDKEEVASIVALNNEVKRKTEGDFTWYPLTRSDAIFQSDSIFTSSNGDAEIAFKDGSKLFIESSSLITIRTKNNKSLIDVQKGSLSGKLSGQGSLQLQFKDKIQELQGNNSQIKIEMNENGQSNLTVLSGQVQLKADGKDQTLSKNQIALIGEDGKVKSIEKMPIELLLPAANEKIWHKKNEKDVLFQWKCDEKVDFYTFELSLHADFREVLIKKDTSKNSLNITQIPVGHTYFWRVQALQNFTKELKGPIYSLYLYADRPPHPLLPPLGAPILLPQNEKSLKINFTWTDLSGSQDFLLQLAHDASFKQIVWEKKIKAKTFTSDPLTSHRYYWRIKSLDPARQNAPWSSVFNFEINGSFPAGMTFFGGKGLKAPQMGMSQVLSDAGLTPVFFWKRVPGAESYQVQLASDPGFNKIVQQTQVSSTQYQVEVKNPQAYYIRVAGIEKERYQGQWGRVIKFNIHPPIAAPKLLSPLEEKFYFSKNNILFKWSLIPGIEAYQIQVADNLLFQKPLINKVLSQDKIILNFPEEKKYYWRLRGVKYSPYEQINQNQNADGNATSKKLISKVTLYTNPHVIQVIKNLPPVKISQAQKDFYLNAIKELTWQNDYQKDHKEQIEKYEVDLSSDSVFKKSPMTKTFQTKINKLTLPIFEQGRFFWRVRYLTKNKIYSPYSQIGLINILPPTDIPLIKNRFIKGAKGQKLLLEWSHIKENISYEIYLSKNKESLQKIPLSKIPDLPLNNFSDQEIKNSAQQNLSTSTRSTVNALSTVNSPIPSLIPGDIKQIITKKDQNKLEITFQDLGFLYWQVRTVLTEDQVGPFSQLAAIQLLNLLPPPELSLTEEKYIIKHDERVNDRLKWSQVPEAKSYLVEIANNKNFQKSLKIKTNKNSLPFYPQFFNGFNYWRVASVGSDQVPGPFSASLSFLLIKKLKAPISLVEKAKNPPFLSWSKIPAAKNYQVEIAKNADLFPGNHLKFETQDRSFDVSSIKQGIYYWRVKAVDQFGYPGELSAVEKFQMLDNGTVVHCANEKDLKKAELDKLFFDEKNNCIIILP